MSIVDVNFTARSACASVLSACRYEMHSLSRAADNTDVVIGAFLQVRVKCTEPLSVPMHP